MRKRHPFAAAVGLLAAMAVMSAQAKPNFSGRWVLVSPADSAGQEQTVTHDATTLKTGHASSGHGHAMVYKLDGTEHRNVLVSHNEDIVTMSKASWSGDKLTLITDTTYPDGRKRHAEGVWSLDAAGRLVVEFVENGPGPTPKTMKLVYAKQ
jgi:hypothetical protein